METVKISPEVLELAKNNAVHGVPLEQSNAFFSALGRAVLFAARMEDSEVDTELLEKEICIPRWMGRGN